MASLERDMPENLGINNYFSDNLPDTTHDDILKVLECLLLEK